MAAAKKKDDGGWMAGAIIVALVVGVVFSLYHYAKLKPKYMTGPQVHRVFDIGTSWDAMVQSGGVALLYIFAAGMLYAERPGSAFLSVPLGLYLLNWVGKIQATAFLGVVVDYTQGLVFFPANHESLDITDYLLIIPVVRLYTTMDSVPLADVQRITRQAGKSLFLHGDFGSRRITFSNKLKRDECIHLVTSAGKGRVKVAMELE